MSVARWARWLCACCRWFGGLRSRCRHQLVMVLGEAGHHRCCRLSWVFSRPPASAAGQGPGRERRERLSGGKRQPQSITRRPTPPGEGNAGWGGWRRAQGVRRRAPGEAAVMVPPGPAARLGWRRSSATSSSWRTRRARRQRSSRTPLRRSCSPMVWSVLVIGDRPSGSPSVRTVKPCPGGRAIRRLLRLACSVLDQ